MENGRNERFVDELDLETVAGGAKVPGERLHFECLYVNFMDGYVCPCTTYTNAPSVRLRDCARRHAGVPIEQIHIFHADGVRELDYTATFGENDVRPNEVLKAYLV